MVASSQRAIARAIPRGRPGATGAAPIPVWTNDVSLSFIDANGNPIGPPPKNLLGPEGPSGDFRNFETRTRAIAASISPMLISIEIMRYADGYPKAPAVYIHGTSSGPMAFQDSGGSGTWWELDVTGYDLDVRWFGAKGDASGDTAEIAAALAVLGNAGGGILRFPAGIFVTSATQNVPINVGLKGIGGLASELRAVDCDALHYSWTTGLGNAIIDGLFINGSGATAARTGIYQHGDLVDFDLRAYGFSILNCIIYNFDVGVKLQSSQNFELFNTWIQNVNYALQLAVALAGRITDCTFVRATAPPFMSGDGKSRAIYLIPGTYTQGTRRPEGVIVTNGQFVGFDRGIDALSCIWLVTADTSIEANEYGIIFTEVLNGIVVKGCYIQMDAGGQAAIFGTGYSSVLVGDIKIKDNTLISADGLTPDGIKLNGAGFANSVPPASLEGNYIVGMASYDILLLTPGHTKVADNTCASNGTASIYVDTRASGVISLDHNDCTKGIVYVTASDVTNGYVRHRGNVINGSTIEADA